MKTLKVKQIALSGKWICMHEFPFPEMLDPGFYRTMISYGAFFESAKQRNWSDKYLYLVVKEYGYRPAWELEEIAKLPIVKHENLLDFFKNIGYDRKSKKFITDGLHSY